VIPYGNWHSVAVSWSFSINGLQYLYLYLYLLCPSDCLSANVIVISEYLGQRSKSRSLIKLTKCAICMAGHTWRNWFFSTENVPRAENSNLITELVINISNPRCQSIIHAANRAAPGGKRDERVLPFPVIHTQRHVETILLTQRKQGKLKLVAYKLLSLLCIIV